MNTHDCCNCPIALEGNCDPICDCYPATVEEFGPITVSPPAKILQYAHPDCNGCDLQCDCPAYPSGDCPDPG